MTRSRKKSNWGAANIWRDSKYQLTQKVGLGMWHAFLEQHKSSLSRSNAVMAYYALVGQPGNSLTGGETDDDNPSPEWKRYLDDHSLGKYF